MFTILVLVDIVHMPEGHGSAGNGRVRAALPAGAVGQVV